MTSNESYLPGANSIQGPDASELPAGPVPAPVDAGEQRKGKVARLPKVVRDEINEMIRDGVTYRQIIARLGAVGEGLSENNISNWKAGGYLDWLRQQQYVEVLRGRLEMALDLLKENPGTTLHDAGRQVVAGQLCEMLVDFEPKAVVGNLQEKPELYLRTINALARLSEGEVACGNRRLQEAALKAKLAKEETGQGQNVITDESLKQAQQRLHLH